MPTPAVSLLLGESNKLSTCAFAYKVPVIPYGIARLREPHPCTLYPGRLGDCVFLDGLGETEKAQS